MNGRRPDAIATGAQPRRPAGLAPVGRRALLIALAAAACAPADPPRPVMRPFDYAHLTPLRLDVAQVEIVEAWVPPRAPPHVDHRAPVEPREAVRRMLADRVQAWGRRGRARAIIEQASLVEERLPRRGGLGGVFSREATERYVLTLAVRLEVEAADGRRGMAEASVRRVRSVLEGTSAAAREAIWYEMLRSAMDDPQGLNVEFEFQVRRALRPFLVPEGTPRPPPGGVEVEDLPAPAAAPTAPAAVAPAAPATGTLGTLRLR